MLDVLLIGAGSATSRLNVALVQQGFGIAAQLPSLTPQILDGFDNAKAIVVVAPESSVMIDTLVKAAERGRYLFVVAGGNDAVLAWANSVNIPVYAYPPSDLDTNNLISELRRVEAGAVATDDQYRRAVLGSDMAARLQSGMAVRKIAVTSPKGGTGKTTISVNLAVAMALCGVSTFLVDADANAGALTYHLRMQGVNVNARLMSLLRRDFNEPTGVMKSIATAATYLPAFNQIDELPALRYLPGLTTDDLADPVFSTAEGVERINRVIEGLYNTGPASNGITIMDVGINPAHPLHSAALREAEAIVIVIKPEIPDLAETRRWLHGILKQVSEIAGKSAAHEFVRTRVKICYNQVVSDSFKKNHELLRQSLKNDGLDFDIVPNGIIPAVDPTIAEVAVNSERRQDILIWRAKIQNPEELRPFSEALIGFASHFVPSLPEAAARVGFPGFNNKEKKRGFRLFGK